MERTLVKFLHNIVINPTYTVFIADSISSPFFCDGCKFVLPIQKDLDQLLRVVEKIGDTGKILSNVQITVPFIIRVT
jgi:hypothetical protein